MLLNRRFANIDSSEQLLKSICHQLKLLRSFFEKLYESQWEREWSRYMSEISVCPRGSVPWERFRTLVSTTNRICPATSVVFTLNFIFFSFYCIRFPAYFNSEFPSQALNLPRVNNSVIKGAVTFRRRFPLREKFVSCAQLSGRVCGPHSLFSSVYLGFFSKGKVAGAWNWPFASILSKSDKELSYILPFPLRKIWFFNTCRTNSPSFLYLWILFNIGRIPRTGNRPLTTLIL